MRKYLIFGICALVLCACDNKPVLTDDLKCGDMDVLVTVFKRRADAEIGGEMARLKRTETDNGVRYDGKVGDQLMAMWHKGSEWIMVVGEANAVKCVKKAMEEVVVAE
ncbi:MAG: hypothetical protein FWF97_01465 [Alphaproteobacteria bacterium]|nr:hypothetical protein [Alphaproteobacteria bacterium]